MRLLLATAVLLFSLPVMAAAADKAQTDETKRSTQADPAIATQLKKLGYEYEVDDDGDYKLTFSLDGDRSQLAFVLSQTESFGQFRIREVWAPAYRSPTGEFMPFKAILIIAAGLVVTDLVAGGATALFAIYHFNRFPTYSVVSNLLAAPVTALWIMPAGESAAASESVRSAFQRWISSPIQASAMRCRIKGSRDFPFARAIATISASSLRNSICWPSVETPRSKARVAIATFQPSPGAPRTFSRAVRAPS